MFLPYICNSSEYWSFYNSLSSSGADDPDFLHIHPLQAEAVSTKEFIAIFNYFFFCV
jgi:hypothetical protein